LNPTSQMQQRRKKNKNNYLSKFEHSLLSALS
jgi:hypothetical protein